MLFDTKNHSKFNSFLQTEGHSDFLTIFDGRGDTSPILEKISGNIGRFNVKSNGNSLFLKFNSDNSNNKDGFSATIHYSKHKI